MSCASSAPTATLDESADTCTPLTANGALLTRVASSASFCPALTNGKFGASALRDVTLTCVNGPTVKTSGPRSRVSSRSLLRSITCVTNRTPHCVCANSTCRRSGATLKTVSRNADRPICTEMTVSELYNCNCGEITAESSKAPLIVTGKANSAESPGPAPEGVKSAPEATNRAASISDSRGSAAEVSVKEKMPSVSVAMAVT